MLSHVLRLQDQGWRGLLPILPPGAEPARWLQPDKAEEVRKAAGKGPGRHVGSGRWGALGDWRAYPDDEATVLAWARWPSVNVGLRAGHAGSGVAFLDADITDPAAAGEVTALIRRRIGLDALVRFGRAPKALFPVRVRGTIRKARSTVVLISGQRCMLEVLAEGQQAVIAGIHPGTGQPYSWPLGGLEDIGPEDLPELTATEIAQLVAAASDILLQHGPAVGRNRSSLLREGTGPRPLDELRARNEDLALDAARFVHNNDWSRDDWVAWCYGLRGAFGDKGRKLWLGFTAQSDKHTSAATARKVWADATRAEEEGRLGSGAGTVLKIARDEGWTPPLRVIEGPAPHYQAEEVGADEAATSFRGTIRRLVEQALAWTGSEPAPQTGVAASAGLGKSTATLEELARAATLPRALDFGDSEQAEVWYFGPTAALNQELAAKARSMGLAAQVVRGREAVVEGEPLCVKHEAAAAIARAGLPVMTMLCRDEDANGQIVTCPHFHGCRYLKQFKTTGPAVRFFAHEYLPLVSHLPKLPPSFGLPPPSLIIIDESFALRLARHASLGIDRLTAPRLGMKIEREAEIQDVAFKVRNLMERDADPRTAADAETFKRIASLEIYFGGEGSIWPGMVWEEQKRRAALLRKTDRFKLAALWRTLADEVAKPRPLQRVALRRNEAARDGETQDRVHVSWRVATRLPDVPVILLDGSLDERIARKFFPRITVETIASRRNAEVVQVADTACSRNRLLSFDGAAEEEQARAANRLQDVRRLAEVEAFSGRTLLVTYKPAAERLGPIPGVDVTHFGALRGLDRFKDHDTIIIAGREQPPPGEVEALALALFGDDEEPLVLSGGFRNETRGYRTRDGRQVGTTVAVHADPRCQVILEQIRERETEQAMDRLRLIHRDRPARVLLLSNVVVDISVDRLTTWRKIMPDRLTVAAARLAGVLPLSPAWLAARYPDLWASPKAVECEIRRAGLIPQTPNKIFYLGNEGLTPAAYRVAGQRGPRPSRALIIEGHPAPEAALAALVGPLTMFRWEVAGAQPEAEAYAHEAPAAEPEAAAVCTRCPEPAAPGQELCSVCLWLAAKAGPEPPRRVAGGRA